MVADDIAYDDESQTHAARLGTPVRNHYRLQLVGVHANPAVLNLYHGASARVQASPKNDGAALRHSVGGIVHQIHQYLRDFVSIGQHRCHSRGDMDTYLDAATREVGPEEFRGLLQKRTNFEQFGWAWTQTRHLRHRAEEPTQPVNFASEAACIGSAQGNVVDFLFQPLDERTHGGKRIAQFVDDD